MLDTLGVALVNGTQVVKLLEETCTDPEQVLDVSPVIVAVVAARLKVTAIVEFKATAVALSAGVVDTASAALVVKPLAVWNCDASATPSLSCAAVVTRIRYVVEPDKVAAGVNV